MAESLWRVALVNEQNKVSSIGSHLYKRIRQAKQISASDSKLSRLGMFRKLGEMLERKAVWRAWWDNEQGFSLLEIAISMFVLGAASYVSYIHRSDHQSSSNRRSQIIKMQSLKASASHEVFRYPYLFPSLNGGAYMRCYDTKATPVPNASNQSTEFTTVDLSDFGVFFTCMKDRTDKNNNDHVQKQCTLDMCSEGTKYMVLICPPGSAKDCKYKTKRNPGENVYALKVFTLNVNTGNVQSVLRSKHIKNIGY